jgi:hypothetical protein
MSDVIERAARMFAVNTAGHELKILHDEGLYRHIYMGKPGTDLYRYELITWPGHLSVGGGMDHYIFSRVEDMFTFFRGHEINPQYWAEKVKDGPKRTSSYSEDRFKARVMDELKHMPMPNLTDEQREARAELLERIADGDAYHAEGARDLLNDAERAGLFSDTWEWNLQDWDYHFAYCLHAIVAGIKAYDAAKTELAVAR